MELDRGRERVRNMVLYEGALYVQTSRSMITALDAETGHQLWAKISGRPEHPSTTFSVADDLLATVNGSRLYICNRYNGELVYETQVAGPPTAARPGARSSPDIPTSTGRMLAYHLEPLTDPAKELGKIKKDLTPEEKAAAEADRRENLRLRQEYIPPLTTQSVGHIYVQPLVTFQITTKNASCGRPDRGVLTSAASIAAIPP